MESVTSYRAEDGKLFESEEECYNYERKGKFYEYYSALDVNQRRAIACDDISSFILNHRFAVLDLLGEGQ